MSDALSQPPFEVDTQAFSDVQEAVGIDQVGEFVDSVIADIGTLIGHLNVGGGPEALDAIGREAHHLSGGCRSLGFSSIGAVCTQIETEARARADHNWPAYAAELGRQRKALTDWWSSVRPS